MIWDLLSFVCKVELAAIVNFQKVRKKILPSNTNSITIKADKSLILSSEQNGNIYVVALQKRCSMPGFSIFCASSATVTPLPTTKSVSDRSAASNLSKVLEDSKYDFQKRFSYTASRPHWYGRPDSLGCNLMAKLRWWLSVTRSILGNGKSLTARYVGQSGTKSKAYSTDEIISCRWGAVGSRERSYYFLTEIKGYNPC